MRSRAVLAAVLALGLSACDSPAPPSAPDVTPAVSSDEDQIRGTVGRFQDAYNAQNWDAYFAEMCPTMRDAFVGVVLDALQETRAANGTTRVEVVDVTVTGGTATAKINSVSETAGAGSAELPLTRADDGWAICRTE